MNMKRLGGLLLSLCFSVPASAELFLVSTSEGPGFTEPKEVIQVLENGIMPTFDYLIELKKKKTIVAGGLPLGSRTFYLIVEADSHDEVDQMLRDIPAWGVFSWQVTPLQSIEGRAALEKEILKSLKSEE
ncbi:hypothetical protein [Photobacterium sp. TY1-4]|uniref:hypothetical protein n=1 Tax=Photobacterium sp. TY1-4 TaxID=2899122 RepID=UPI0021BE453B|nr:hypothetical protein [Photobacterium sp. TY1-4]UXH99924.1 hypothetical protein NH461_08740 [Photobacterium sp. TY1-4]